ncbi:hypothetical protein GCM10010210_10210 [Pseudonocardia hydrocarbonoxydans]|uniref:Lipase n=1 Tax=Pseudonocardia hydrocarbonoxydans TaxID=76726 RepID=A0A4Y3WTC8_9PSEU|nr:hypothetical protein PHY01_36430 [Pseudonocardia hydrocarbonoxydans]
MLPLVANLTGLPGASLAGYATARRAVASVAGRDRSEPGPRVLPGGGGPVVLVGGFCTTDVVLEPMRRWLGDLGYEVSTHTANTGMGCGARSVEEVRETVREAARHDDSGAGVHVVGYSRGGQFARILATEPDSGIRSLVTLGSPFDPYRVGLAAVIPALAVLTAGTLGLPNLATASCVAGSCCADYRSRLRDPLPVPFTSIYSRQDRLVPWRASVDDGARNIEVGGTHLDLVESRAARAAVAQALSRHAQALTGHGRPVSGIVRAS